MSFAKLFLIKLSPDEIIHESAELYREWFQVPESRRWSDVGDDNWTALSEGCIGRDGEKPTKADKLMIIAHGSRDEVGDGVTYAPEKLAKKLKKWGLDEIGLISFKCCHVGSGSFLRKFISQAANSHLSVGWVKGYTGASRTLPALPRFGKPVGTWGKPYELITTPFGIPGYEGYWPVLDRTNVLRGYGDTDFLNYRTLKDSDDR